MASSFFLLENGESGAARWTSAMAWTQSRSKQNSDSTAMSEELMLETDDRVALSSAGCYSRSEGSADAQKKVPANRFAQEAACKSYAKANRAGSKDPTTERT